MSRTVWTFLTTSFPEFHCDRLTQDCVDNQTRSHKATTSWEAKLNSLMWSLDDDKPRFRHEKWRQIFDNAQLKLYPTPVATPANSFFSLPLGQSEEKWTVWLSQENIWSRYSTISHVAVLQGDELKVSLVFLKKFR